MRSLEELQTRGGPAKGFITVCVLLIVSTGAGIFLFLSARAKVRALTPNFMQQGYSKVATEGPSKAIGELGELSERIINCEDDDNEEEEDADIVFMANDGTVYRKFKYGMLDQDEVELEYDDESYSYRWWMTSGQLSVYNVLADIFCVWVNHPDVRTNQHFRLLFKLIQRLRTH